MLDKRQHDNQNRMAYNESTAHRIRAALADQFEISEKKMFGGIAFMLSGHMLCGVNGDELMARVGPEKYQAALGEPFVREMDFTGRPLMGFVYVAPEGFDNDRKLIEWLTLCADFVTSLPPR